MVPAAVAVLPLQLPPARPATISATYRYPPHSNFFCYYSHPSSSSFPVLRSLRTRCRSSSGGAGPGEEEAPPPSRVEEVASGMVEELLRREENKALLERLEEASGRVERARAALADIERQEADVSRAKDYMFQLRSREAEIAESQKELLQARVKMEEAQRSLTANMDDYGNDGSAEEIDKDKERLESAKAALVSSLVGTAASLPISFYQSTNFPQFILHLVVTFISCALFGVTFRYTVRRDLDNLQIKTGTCGAFGVVKGLAALEAGRSLELNTESFMSYSISGAVHVSENIVIFLSAAIALDFCFKTGILSPFPIRK